MAPHLEASPPSYVQRDPRQTILYQVVAEHLETFLATLAADPSAKGLPAYVVEEFYAYLMLAEKNPANKPLIERTERQFKQPGARPPKGLPARR